jgi:hypothetical protein
MRLTRREWTLIPAALTAACGRPTPAPEEQGWPRRWDRILLEKAVEVENRRFDQKERMTTRLLGPGYHYHTRLREMRVHPTRESLDYALALLEKGGVEEKPRALAILGRVLPLQDIDPASRWYGLWGYYLEEPPPEMDPADWNWADFNGGTLLVVEFRHGTELGDGLRAQVREAILHAARSIVRRNVSMRYTNIAVKGTFVTLAAGEALGDTGLLKYARERLARLAETIDETGSFEEYNSPTYARVTLTDLTRIRMYVRDQDSRRLAGRIEHRLWLHLARHWDLRRMQFAGPMSRCYSTGLGRPAWLEKALRGRLKLVSAQDLADSPDADTAIHDYQCPEDLAPQWLAAGDAREHRELFQPGAKGARPVVGTTWIENSFSLGSVNRGDFWMQRRPLLAYFGDATRPARSLTVRVVKDGYDFASALLYSVQRRGWLAGLVAFRDPGGDRHPSLDPVKNGEFRCGRLFLEIDFEGQTEQFRCEQREGVVEVASPRIQARLAVRGGRLGPFEPQVHLTRGSQSAVATIDLLPVGEPHTVRWAAMRQAWLAFTLALAGPEVAESEFDRAFRSASYTQQQQSGRLRLAWATPVGQLSLQGPTGVGPIEKQNALFEERIDGHVPPAPRLSEERLA